MSYAYRGSRSPYAAKRRNQTKTKSRRGGGEYIDPSRFVRVANNSEEAAFEPSNKFVDFPFSEILHENLKKNGYNLPSPIQDQAILPALEGQDIIGIASTGTGKTAAFALPVIQRLINDPTSKALIIAPTRELAQQIEDECRKLGKGSGLLGALLIGGSSMGAQLRDLRSNPSIVIGTPGRIKDHLERDTLQLNNCNLVVLDEVDRMLDMGFVDDVTSILKSTSQIRQTFFFSATIDSKVRRLIDTFAEDPFTVSLKPSTASEKVHQDVVRYQTNADKLDKLHNVLIQESVSKVIIFDETQRSVERLYEELLSRGFPAESIHGGKSQSQRQRALSKFKKSEVNVLVATDVAARGIDVADVSHVINFSVPKAYDDYIHRIGRAGRAGQTGYALTFITQ